MSSADREAARLRLAIGPAWRGAEPSDAAVDRAYQRYVLRRRRGGRAVLVLRPAAWVAFGTLLGIGSLYAATAKPWRSLSGDGATERSAPSPAPPPHRVGTRRSAAPATSVVVVGGESSASRPVPAAPAASPRPRPVAGRALSEEELARESWQRAARGLRERDFASADDALRRLAEQGETREREAALLARAQLMLSQKQWAAAKDLANQLIASAESPSIRSSAAQIVARASQGAQSERSFDPEPRTHSP